MMASGLPLVAGSTSAGQHAWVFESRTVNLLGYTDDGCNRLKGIGNPPPQEARCDITEDSDHQCKCHIKDGSGWHITNGDFCNSWLETHVVAQTELIDLTEWIKLGFISSN
jgi:hypothetical protein